MNKYSEINLPEKSVPKKKSLITYLRRNRGFIHWSAERITSILLLPLFGLLIWDCMFFNSLLVYLPIGYTFVNDGFFFLVPAVFSEIDQYWFLAICIILPFHMRLGIEAIVEDYVHHEKTKKFCFILIKITALILLKELVVLYFSNPFENMLLITPDRVGCDLSYIDESLLAGFHQR